MIVVCVFWCAETDKDQKAAKPHDTENDIRMSLACSAIMPSHIPMVRPGVTFFRVAAFGKRGKAACLHGLISYLIQFDILGLLSNEFQLVESIKLHNLHNSAACH